MKELLVIENRKGSPLGLYDNNDPDNKSVVAEKVIDITPACPKSTHCIIKYANVVRGQIAQIIDCYEIGGDIGRSVHYHINEYTPIQLSIDEVFDRTAKILGIHPMDLAEIIYSNRPI